MTCILATIDCRWYARRYFARGSKPRPARTPKPASISKQVLEAQPADQPVLHTTRSGAAEQARPADAPSRRTARTSQAWRSTCPQPPVRPSAAFFVPDRQACAPVHPRPPTATGCRNRPSPQCDRPVHWHGATHAQARNAPPRPDQPAPRHATAPASDSFQASHCTATDARAARQPRRRPSTGRSKRPHHLTGAPANRPGLPAWVQCLDARNAARTPEQWPAPGRSIHENAQPPPLPPTGGCSRLAPVQRCLR